MPKETAMLLTQQEWEDVASFCETYLANTLWAIFEPQRSAYIRDFGQGAVDMVDRKRRVAQHIVDAAEV